MSANHRRCIEHWGQSGLRLIPLIKKVPPKGFHSYHGVGQFPSEKLDAVPWSRINNLGLVLPPGVIVLDVDVKNGSSGYDHLAELEAEYGVLPPTLRQRTQSGGEHIFIKVPENYEHVRWRGSARLPNSGKRAQIDILHSSYRYAVLYEPEHVLNGLKHLGTLPAEWLIALAKPEDGRGSDHAGGAEEVRYTSHLDVDMALDNLGSTPQGCRNDTLFATGLEILKLNPCDSELRQRLVAAAVQSGISESETRSTLASIERTLWERYGSIYVWLEMALGVVEMSGRRNRARLSSTCIFIASTCIQSEKTSKQGVDVSVWLSVRTLGLQLGVACSTASGYLSALRELEVLRRDRQGRAFKEARSFVLPGTGSGTKPNTHTIVRVSKGCVFDFVSLRLPDLRGHLGLIQHDAFRSRRDGQLVLSPGCSKLLELLTKSPIDKRKAAELLGVHPRTAIRYRNILRGAGLIAEDEHGHLILRDPDLKSGLDALSERVGIPKRGEAQLQIVNNARRAFAEIERWSGSPTQLRGGSRRIKK